MMTHILDCAAAMSRLYTFMVTQKGKDGTAPIAPDPSLDAKRAISSFALRQALAGFLGRREADCPAVNRLLRAFPDDYKSKYGLSWLPVHGAALGID
jgi:hypothetical protein